MSDYVVIVEPSSEGWGAWSPDLNVYATADTRAEVEDQVRDAIAFHLALADLPDSTVLPWSPASTANASAACTQERVEEGGQGC